MIKQLVMMYVNTITVRMQAIRSASASELPDFSPRALAQSLQIVFIVYDISIFPKQELSCKCVLVVQCVRMPAKGLYR
jgi:hypothetical protein